MARTEPIRKPPRPATAPAAQAVNLTALEQLVRPAVEGQGYDLVDLAWVRELGRWILRVTIDRRPGQGYVSHEDCSNVSREVSALLDVHDVLPGHYSLEVSSPGPHRPLKTAADFQRFCGQRAKVRLKVGLPPQGDGPAGPRRNFTGTITAVEDGHVRLATGDGEEVSLEVADVEKANLIDLA